MNQNDIIVGEAFINLLNDSYDECFVVTESTGSSYSCFLFNIINNQAALDENFKIINFIKVTPSEIRKEAFKKNGIYIYRYNQKELTEYKFVEKSDLPISLIEGNLTSSKDICFIALYQLYNISPLDENENKKLRENLKSEETSSEQNNISYKGITIAVTGDILEGNRHIVEDYNVLDKENIETIIREKFLTWFKHDEIKDSDDDKIIEGLKITEITYDYHKIAAQYSPTSEDAYFGEFDFTFESCSDYTKDMLEAVVMQVYVKDGKVLKVSGYNV